MGISAKIWEGLHSCIRNKTSLPKDMKLVKTWNFYNRPAHAGQIYTQKTLPNGNVQKRLTTVYGNYAIGLETSVYSPKGELLKAYAGVRNTEKGVTSRYASGSKKEVIPILDSMYNHQGSVRSLLYNA